MAAVEEDSIDMDFEELNDQIKPPQCLLCPVCLDVFRNPCLLPCSHTVCKICLEGISTSITQDDQLGGIRTEHIPCPVCRYKIHNDNLSNVPENRALEHVIADWKERAQRQRINWCKKQVGTCTEHGEAADHWCSDCSDSVCLACLSGPHAGHTVTFNQDFEDTTDRAASVLCQALLLFSKKDEIGSRLHFVNNRNSDLLDEHTKWLATLDMVEAQIMQVVNNKFADLRSSMFQLFKKTQANMTMCQKDCLNTLDTLSEYLKMAPRFMEKNPEDLTRVNELIHDKISFYLNDAQPMIDQTVGTYKTSAEQSLRVSNKLKDMMEATDLFKHVLYNRHPRGDTQETGSGDLIASHGSPSFLYDSVVTAANPTSFLRGTVDPTRRVGGVPRTVSDTAAASRVDTPQVSPQAATGLSTLYHPGYERPRAYVPPHRSGLFQSRLTPAQAYGALNNPSPGSVNHLLSSPTLLHRTPPGLNLNQITPPLPPIQPFSSSGAMPTVTMTTPGQQLYPGQQVPWAIGGQTGVVAPVTVIRRHPPAGQPGAGRELRGERQSITPRYLQRYRDHYRAPRHNREFVNLLMNNRLDRTELNQINMNAEERQTSGGTHNPPRPSRHESEYVTLLQQRVSQNQTSHPDINTGQRNGLTVAPLPFANEQIDSPRDNVYDEVFIVDDNDENEGLNQSAMDESDTDQV